MDILTVSFFGHREISNLFQAERRVECLLRKLLNEKEYVEILIGREGEFDQIVSSTVRRMWIEIGKHNSELNWVLPYPMAEYDRNKESFDKYYSNVELCIEAANAYPKAAIQIRNRRMVDRSELVVFYVEHNSGGAYQTMKYAMKQGKSIINLVQIDD